MRPFKTHAPAKRPEALNGFPGGGPSGPAPAAPRRGSPVKPFGGDGTEGASWGNPPQPSASRPMPADPAFMMSYLPSRRASTKRRSTSAP